MENLREIKQQYKEDIKRIKSSLIDKNANLNNKIGLIGSDASKLLRIKEIVQEFKKDIIFYNNQNFKI